MTQAIKHHSSRKLARPQGLACLGALLVSVLVPTPAWADWAKVAETETMTLYMDRSSMQSEEDVRRVWEIQDLKVPDADGVRSRRYLNEYNCKYQMYRIGNMTSYSGPMLTGRKLFEVSEMGNWRKVGGRTAFTLSFVVHCGR